MTLTVALDVTTMAAVVDLVPRKEGGSLDLVPGRLLHKDAFLAHWGRLTSPPPPSSLNPEMVALRSAVVFSLSLLS